MSKFVEVKTAELVGPAQDWAVAMAVHGVDPLDIDDDVCGYWYDEDSDRWLVKYWRPSIDWEQGGPLLDSMVIGVIHNSRIRPHPFDKGYQAMASHFIGPSEGHTILIAACRAIVAAKLGDVVQVPAELVGVDA